MLHSELRVPRIFVLGVSIPCGIIQVFKLVASQDQQILTPDQMVSFGLELCLTLTFQACSAQTGLLSG